MASNVNFSDLANFQPKQLVAYRTLFKPDCKYLLYGGAAAGGKSYFLRWAAAALGMYYSSKYKIKGVPIGLFSADYPSLKDRQVKNIKKEFPEWLGQIKETRDEGYAFHSYAKWGGWVIMLRNLDDPSKYKSVEFAAELVEELTENPRATFDDLRFRLRYPGIKDPKFVGATNPGGVGHGYVKRLWVKPDLSDPDVEQKLFKFVGAKYQDNEYIDEDYVNQLRALPEEKRRAYMDGDWDVFVGQVFGEWRDALHVIPRFTPIKEYLIVGGLDWGRTHPFSLHLDLVSREYFNGIQFYRSKTFLELYGTNKRPKEWGKLLVNHLENYNLTVDNLDFIMCDNQIFDKGLDGGISIHDQFCEASPKLKGKLRRGSKDRIGGVELIHRWLSIAPDGLPYWQVSEDCPNLIRTIPELVHDENKVEDVNSAGEDHAFDDSKYKFKAVPFVDARAIGVNRGGVETTSDFGDEVEAWGEE